MAKKYLLGLDLGTDSVGWCLTDENGKIAKKHGRSLWGVRLFDEAQTAKSRRQSRIARRRITRRSERIDLLQTFFFDEFTKIDPTFFVRLNNSAFKRDDKDPSLNGVRSVLFNDKGYTDREYFKEYPTIYHLRKAMLDHPEKKFDIRMIYLVFHHMVKYRGNFLMPGFKVGDNTEAKQRFDEMISIVNVNSESDLNPVFDEILRIFKENKGVNRKKTALAALLGDKAKSGFTKEVFIPLLSGSGYPWKKACPNLDDDADFPKICLENDIEEKVAQLSDAVAGSEYEWHVDFVRAAKATYDYLKLIMLLGDYKGISDLMVGRYDKHRSDLKALRTLVRDHFDSKTYDEVFRAHDLPANYARYVGMTKVGKELHRLDHCTKDEFCKYLNDLLSKKGLIAKKGKETVPFENLTEDEKLLVQSIIDKNILPRQNATDNGIFPNQLNLYEMHRIIENQSKFYAFFGEKDDEGLSVGQKIESILKFQIPYYVGPLMAHKEGDPRSSHSWMVRKKEGKIYPWNFEQMVDLDRSSEEFIQRMLNRCSYLRNEYCLPSNSVIFEKYNVLNYVNKIYLNGKPITVEEKQKLFEEVFLTQKKPTPKSIEKHFKKITGNSETQITTSTGKPLEAAMPSMASYCTFKSILGEAYNGDQVEEIIRDITIFPDSDTIAKRLRKYYGFTDERLISKIKGIRYSGWGRLSKKLLTGLETPVENNDYGEVTMKTILQIMWETNKNFMEIINDPAYSFSDLIDQENGQNSADDSKGTRLDSIKQYIDEEYVSPAIRRSIWQSIQIVDELQRIVGKPISEYYVEVTRSGKAEKKRTKSRKDRIAELYNEAMKTAGAELKKQLESCKESLSQKEDSQLRSDKYLLYFLQLGKCAYTGEPIDLGDLNTSATDIDHIIPQSKLKDDSISNRVLVKQDANRAKGDRFPISSEIRNRMWKIWKSWKDAGLMDDKKFHNLTRQDNLSEEELNSFVQRQLVFTSQSVKATAEILKKFMKKEDGSDPLVVYSKAENVSDFRKQFDVLKSRDANSFHHAHDAFLNIAVGRRIYHYFGGSNPKLIAERLKKLELEHRTLNVKKIFQEIDSNYFKTHNEHLKPVFDKDDGLIWDFQDSLPYIQKIIRKRFDILMTTRQYFPGGILNKVSIHKASEYKDGNLFPIKSKGDSPFKKTKEYGGYLDLTSGFFSLVSRETKREKEYSIEAIPSIYARPGDIEGIKKYLQTRQSSSTGLTVEVPCLRSNFVLCRGESVVNVTGRSGSVLILKNANEPFFDYDHIRTIRKIRKYLDICGDRSYLLSVDDQEEENSVSQKMVVSAAVGGDGAGGERKDYLLISPGKNNRALEIKLERDEMVSLFFDIVKKASSKLFENLSAVYRVGQKMRAEETTKAFLDLPLYRMPLVLEQMLKLISTTRELANLTEIGLSQYSGNITIAKNKLDGVRVVSQSITGFYTKTIWENK